VRKHLRGCMPADVPVRMLLLMLLLMLPLRLPLLSGPHFIASDHDTHLRRIDIGAHRCVELRQRQAADLLVQLGSPLIVAIERQ